MLAQFCAAQANPVSLDTNETLFAVMTGINACGYDADLAVSDPIRREIREEVAAKVAASEEAKQAEAEMCKAYQERLESSASRNLTQYISLSLFLLPPPALTLKVREAELPPDAIALVGFVEPLEKFYSAAGVHAIWQKHAAAYAKFAGDYHEAVAKMLFDTEIYLKFPSATYLGRGFTVYLEPMGSPMETNARNYGADYYVVISPGKDVPLKMDQIRHTYLHYLLDPLALKYPTFLKRLNPLLESVKSAPMNESFKEDPALLATESLIRAIEARSGAMSKAPDAQRETVVQQSMEQGFILTQYFYDALAQFEKGPAGLRNVFGDMISAIDLRKVEKVAGETKFSAEADPELLQMSRPIANKLLLTAEQRLNAGDAEAAGKLAQEALNEKKEDPGRALFILAQVATRNRDIQGARTYFLKALEASKDPKIVAWSHIYLGRILDLQDERQAALDHYRAALDAGGALPEAKAAAQQGLQQPFAPPGRSQKN